MLDCGRTRLGRWHSNAWSLVLVTRADLVTRVRREGNPTATTKARGSGGAPRWVGERVLASFPGRLQEAGDTCVNDRFVGDFLVSFARFPPFYAVHGLFFRVKMVGWALA